MYVKLNRYSGYNDVLLAILLPKGQSKTSAYGYRQTQI